MSEAPNADLPEFSSAFRCPKCLWQGAMIQRYCDSLHRSTLSGVESYLMLSRRPKAEIEHLHIVCGNCGYEHSVRCHDYTHEQ